MPEIDAVGRFLLGHFLNSLWCPSTHGNPQKAPPLTGIIKVSGAPLQKALTLLGK